MSAPGGASSLHGVLQEATGCAMDTERDWVAQLKARSYMVHAVPLGEAVTEEIQAMQTFCVMARSYVRHT